MAHLPFNPKDLDAQGLSIYRAMVAKRKSVGAPLGGPYAALMHHPVLCEKVEALGYFLKFEGHLPRDVYQFVVLAVAKETQVDFEWHDHINHAVAAGLPQAVIDELQAHGLASEGLPAPYHEVAELLRYTLAWRDIPSPLQRSVIASLGLHGLLEVVVLSGFYQLMSAINGGFDVER